MTIAFTRRAVRPGGSFRRGRPRRRRVRSRLGRRAPADRRRALGAGRRFRAARSAPSSWSSRTTRSSLRVAKSEMGQGVLTSLRHDPRRRADCDFAKVRVEYASAHRNLAEDNIYQSMGTGGSSSVRRSRVLLQQAGASARERLIAAAAARWGVRRRPAPRAAGMVRHDASGRSATFGELAAEAAQIAARGRAGDQDAGTFQADRHAPDALRYAAEGHRRGAVRHRREAAAAWSMPRSPIARCSAAR